MNLRDLVANLLLCLIDGILSHLLGSLGNVLHSICDIGYRVLNLRLDIVESTFCL